MQKLTPEDSVLTTDLIGAYHPVFKKSLHSALAHFEKLLGFCGCIDHSWPYLFVHNPSIGQVSKGVK